MNNLLETWNDVLVPWAGREIALFLDYDGTLSPIAPTPAEAVLPEENRGLLERLVHRPSLYVAVISGRTLQDIKHVVGIEGITYIGNHGWEMDDASMHFESLIPMEVSSVMKKIKYELITQLSDIRGAFVEDKGATLSVHYRLADPGREGLIKRIFDFICLPYRRQNLISVRTGKKVLELRPPLAWDKGKAALWLLRKQEIVHGRGQVLPVYIGDDTTDEDAFEALRNRGLTVFVGSPRRFTSAQYYLSSPEEVTEFLRHMADGLYMK